MNTGLGDSLVLNSRKYPLVREKGRLGIQQLGSINLHNTNPAIPVTEEWNSWHDGMGEARRLDPESSGVLFSTGAQTSEYGVMHFPHRRVKLTPDAPLTDKPTGFITGRPAGNFVSSTGNFTVTGATQTVAHNLGTTPEFAIFVMASGGTDGALTANAAIGIGVSDGTNNAGSVFASFNGQATSVTERAYSVTESILTTDGLGALALQGHVTSFDATNINITWTDNGAETEVIQFYVGGGEDVEAFVKNWTRTTGTGNQSVTGVGFTPKTVLHLSTGDAAAGVNDGARLGIGAMDDSGNEFALSCVSADNVGTSDTATIAYNNLCGAVLQNTSSAVARNSYVSMDADGFTINKEDSAGATLASALCLKGVQVKVGNTSIVTTATNTQDAETIGFTTTSFLAFGSRNTTINTITANASLGMGMVAGASSVETAAIHDEDNVGTTDADRVHDTTAALSIISDTAIIDEATCGNIDMETAGWLTWGTESGTAHLLHFIGFAALEKSDNLMLYCENGQNSTKFYFSGDDTLTEIESHAYGNDAQTGTPKEFESNHYIPLGGVANAAKRTFIADIGGSDTYGTVTGTNAANNPVIAYSFTSFQDGSTHRIFYSIDNDVYTSPDGSTWAGAFEVGDDQTRIVEMATRASGAIIAKSDNLYIFDPDSASFKVTAHASNIKDNQNGTGLSNFEGTDAVVWNGPVGLELWDGASRPYKVGPDSLEENVFLPNITHEPRGARFYETATIGDWLWALGRITETTTVTYIFAIHRDRIRNLWNIHVFDRLDGIARGLDSIQQDDGKRVLFTGWVSDQSIMYYRIGRDGAPHAGRDATGYGSASATYYTYLSEAYFGHPHIRKELRMVEGFLRGTFTNADIRVVFHIDDASESTPVAAFGASGQVKKGVASSTSGYGFIAAPKFTSDGTYDPTTAAGDNPPTLTRLKLHAFLRPTAQDFARAYRFTVDTGEMFEGGIEPPDDAKTMLANLRALPTGAPITAAWEGEPSVTLIITNIAEPIFRHTDVGPRWVIEVDGVQWVNS